MELEKKNTGLIISLIIVAILTALCVLFATGTIDLKNKDTNTNTENDSIEEEKLALGLSMLKFANGASGYFSTIKTDDEKYLISNYKQVAILFTDDFIKNAQANAEKYHICWPTKEGDNYYVNTQCGFGGPQSYTYKTMKITNYNDTKIDYEITYDEYALDTKEHKDIYHKFQLVLVDNMWKINDYYNIY